MDRERWQTLMFDSAFQISDVYFSILQMLRIFNDWLNDVEESLPRLYDEVERAALDLPKSCPGDESDESENTFEFKLDMDILSKNLRKLDVKIQSDVNELQSRIERKRVEVESLRDGVRGTLRNSTHKRYAKC